MTRFSLQLLSFQKSKNPVLSFMYCMVPSMKVFKLRMIMMFNIQESTYMCHHLLKYCVLRIFLSEAVYLVQPQACSFRRRDIYKRIPYWLSFATIYHMQLLPTLINAQSIMNSDNLHLVCLQQLTCFVYLLSVPNGKVVFSILTQPQDTFHSERLTKYNYSAQ